MAAQAGLCLVWSETPEDTFSRDEAHKYAHLFVQTHITDCFCNMYYEKDVSYSISNVLYVFNKCLNIQYILTVSKTYINHLLTILTFLPVFVVSVQCPAV